METFIKADIFFFITTVVEVIVGLGLLAIIIYLIGILRDFKTVSERIKNESNKAFDMGLWNFIKESLGKKSRGRKNYKK
jgi:hypothetical protein